MFNKLKQIKDLRSQAKKLQSQLSEESIEGSAGWGKIKVTIDGNQNVKSISIDPEYLSLDKKEKLENDLKSAFQDAMKKLQKIMIGKVKESNIDLSAFQK